MSMVSLILDVGLVLVVNEGMRGDGWTREGWVPHLKKLFK